MEYQIIIPMSEYNEFIEWKEKNKTKGKKQEIRNYSNYDEIPF